MKVHGIWVFFFVVGLALLVFTFSSSSSIPGMEFSQLGNGVSITGTSRKLKGNGCNLSNEKKSNVDLEDYRPIDPVPSSKAAIKPGPIEHGSPLIPSIPKPSPPAHPNSGGST
ncbi:uncharacterized protein LOC110417044 [Herrania umbratica]|uniref:Uncharacterized protein LOC110417044 n=1 Tax=Herrania umbratica TaxID=108875 RepID=A0A6J1ADK7_9ROSI|nr:uncharacterized protein LOC110417044 [Herrania umbratica]